MVFQYGVLRDGGGNRALAACRQRRTGIWAATGGRKGLPASLRADDTAQCTEDSRG